MTHVSVSLGEEIPHGPGRTPTTDKRPKNPPPKQPPDPPDHGPINLHAKYHRIDVHGVPVPDASPTGESEDDRLPNMTHVDMYSLAPTFAVTDIAVPLEGSELTLELRRTTGIRSRPLRGDAAARFIPWASQNVFGMGWDTNLKCRAIVSSNAGDPPTLEVMDDVGNSYLYTVELVGAQMRSFTPDVYHSFSSDSLRTHVNSPAPNAIEFRQGYGTRILFERVKAKSSDRGRHSEVYFRPREVLDRNGNSIIYEYDDAAATGRDEELLVRAMYDSAYPERRIAYEYGDFGDDLTVGDYGWRLVRAIDPLGRSFGFAYDAPSAPSTLAPHLLHETTWPEVTDDTAAPPALASPTTRFTYYADTLDGSQQFSENLYVAPATIADPRGHVTTIAYTTEPFPVTVLPSGAVVSWQETPRVASMNTVDGTAVLVTLERNGKRVHTTTTDTRGVLVEYDFRSIIVAADNSWGAAFVVVSLDRTTHDGTTPPPFAHFEWSPDINANLLSVLDMSGNVTEYRYRTGDPNDPYDAPIYLLDPHDDMENPTHYQAFNHPAARIVDPQGLALMTTYRYDLTFNKLITTIDATGKTTTSDLDANGNLVTLREELGRMTTFGYESDGFLSRVTDPDGRLTTFERWFDPAHLDAYRATKSTVLGYTLGPQLAISTEKTADIMGNVVLMTDANGNEVVQEFDALNRLARTTLPPVEDPADPQGALVTSTVEKHRDLNGNVVREVSGVGDVTIHSFDEMNRETTRRRRVTSPTVDDDTNDIISQTTYTPVGQVAASTDPNGNVTAFEYDAVLRLVRRRLPSVTLASGAVEQYEEQFEYGQNSGAGAFAYWSGWQPTRRVNRRGYAIDDAYDNAYRHLSTIRRSDDPAPVASTDPPRQAEPASQLEHDAVGNVIVLRVPNEDVLGSDATRVTYTYYDSLHRPTITAQMLSGGPPPLPPGTVVDDAATFPQLPDELITRTSYDRAGHVVLAVDAEGSPTRCEFDGAGRCVARALAAVDVVDPAGFNASTQLVPRVLLTYDGNGNIVESEDENHTRVRFEYDARNRLSRTIVDLDGQGTFSRSRGAGDIVTERHYDLHGRQLRVVDPLGYETSTEWDAADRPVRVVLPPVPDARAGGAPTSPVVESTYDRNGNVLMTTNAVGVATTTEWDELNRARRTTVAASTRAQLETETEFDANGNPTAVTVHNGNQPQSTLYTYDPFDRRIAEVLPLVGDRHRRVTHTSYDRLGKVTKIRDPKGQTIEQVVDRAGRLTCNIYRARDGRIHETRTITYNGMGKPLLVTDASGVTRYEYDALYRPTSEYRRDRSGQPYVVRSAYDARGNRTQVVLASGRKLELFYDRNQRLVAVEDGADRTTIAYNDTGNRVSLATPNGVETRYDYDALGRIVGIEARSSVGRIVEAKYEHDLGGKRVRSTERTQAGSRRATYAYDEQQRLTRETRHGERRDYRYDSVGNRTRLVVRNGGGVTRADYEYDRLNRLVAERLGGAVTNFDYDLNGNLVRRQNGAHGETYQWDCSNRLVAVGGAQPASRFAAAYDYRYRRLSKHEGPVTTAYRYDGGDCIEELAGATPVRELVRSAGLGGGIAGVLYVQDAGGSPETFAYDPVGDTIALSDRSGRTSATYTYDAFGAVVDHTGSASTTRLANTKELDATGLYYHGARYFDPNLGRYISRDPAGGLGGINPYTYAHNDPVNCVDPLGLWDWGTFLEDLAVGVAAVAVVAVAIAVAPVVLPVLAAAAVDAAATVAGGAALALGAEAATAGAIAGTVAAAGATVVAEGALVAEAGVAAAGIVGTADMLSRAASGQMSDEEAAATVLTLGFGVVAGEAMEAKNALAQATAEEGPLIRTSVNAQTNGPDILEEIPQIVTEGTYNGEPYSWTTTVRATDGELNVLDPVMMRVDPAIQGRGVGTAIADEHLARAHEIGDMLGIPPEKRFYRGSAVSQSGKGVARRYFPQGMSERPLGKNPLPQPVGPKKVPTPVNRTATGLALLGAADAIAYVASPQ